MHVIANVIAIVDNIVLEAFERLIEVSPKSFLECSCPPCFSAPKANMNVGGLHVNDICWQYERLNCASSL